MKLFLFLPKSRVFSHQNSLNSCIFGMQKSVPGLSDRLYIISIGLPLKYLSDIHCRHTFWIFVSSFFSESWCHSYLGIEKIVIKCLVRLLKHYPILTISEIDTWLCPQKLTLSMKLVNISWQNRSVLIRFIKMCKCTCVLRCRHSLNKISYILSFKKSKSWLVMLLSGLSNSEADLSLIFTI